MVSTKDINLSFGFIILVNISQNLCYDVRKHNFNRK